MREKYLFRKEELEVLLSLKGRSGFYGLSSEERIPSRQMAVDVLRSLSEKEFLLSDGTSFRMQEEIREIVSLLADARQVVEFLPFTEDYPQLCLYPGERTVTMEWSGRKKGEMKAGIVQGEEIFGFLQEAEAMPELPSLFDARERELFGRERQEYFPCWEARCRSIETGEIQKTLTLKKGPRFYVFLSSENEWSEEAPADLDYGKRSIEWMVDYE